MVSCIKNLLLSSGQVRNQLIYGHCHTALMDSTDATLALLKPVPLLDMIKVPSNLGTLPAMGGRNTHIGTLDARLDSVCAPFFENRASPTVRFPVEPKRSSGNCILTRPIGALQRE